MRIVFFVANLNAYSGASQQALSLAKGITGDFNFFFINKSSSSGFRKEYYVDGFRVIDLPSSRILQAFVVMYYGLKWSVDVFHLHGFNFSGILVSKILRKPNVLKTTLIGYDDFETWQGHWQGRIKLFLLRWVNVNVVLSKIAFEKNVKLAPKSLVLKVISNGVCIKDFCVSEKKMDFCVVGLINQRKRTYEAIKYFLDNYHISGNSKLYVIGPLVNSDGLTEFSNKYIERCQRLVVEHNAQETVLFTGKLDKETVYSFLSSSLGLLFFSESEGMPNVVLEALAHNCVPLMSELQGDSYDIIVTGKEGFILKDFNEKIKISSILEISKSCSPYRRSKVYSFENVGLRYSKLYEDLVYGKGSC